MGDFEPLRVELQVNLSGTPARASGADLPARNVLQSQSHALVAAE